MESMKSAAHTVFSVKPHTVLIYTYIYRALSFLPRVQLLIGTEREKEREIGQGFPHKREK